MVKDFSWLCTQELFLMVSEDHVKHWRFKVEHVQGKHLTRSTTICIPGMKVLT